MFYRPHFQEELIRWNIRSRKFDACLPNSKVINSRQRAPARNETTERESLSFLKHKPATAGEKNTGCVWLHTYKKKYNCSIMRPELAHTLTHRRWAFVEPGIWSDEEGCGGALVEPAERFIFRAVTRGLRAAQRSVSATQCARSTQREAFSFFSMAVRTSLSATQANLHPAFWWVKKGRTFADRGLPSLCSHVTRTDEPPPGPLSSAAP